MSGEARRGIRLYASARTAHLERLAQMLPAEFVYTSTRYDFDESVLGDLPRPRRMSRPATVWHLLRHSYDVVEINEPFMIARWPDLIGQIAAVRLRAIATRRSAIITTYVLSLKNPVDDLAQRRLVPARFAPWIARRMLTALVRRIDRIAFGTHAARDLMVDYVDASLVDARSAVFPAVSAPCTCATVGEMAADRSDGLLFVGAFVERKGVRELMSAWDDVVAARPGATLTMIGKGPLTEEVSAWAAGRSSVSVTVDPPRSTIHAAMRSATAVVMLSQRQGTWREQVGLPILEGLSHGARIVTTDETGLAGWLSEHGHVVVPVASPTERYAAGIVGALSGGPSPIDVLDSLPPVDARITADRWMFTGSTAPLESERSHVDRAGTERR